MNDHETIDCEMDGCGGHVFTADADADNAAYEAKPNLGMDAWKRDIEESDKGFFVTMPKRERRGPPP
jgi:hypothetical protein